MHASSKHSLLTKIANYVEEYWIPKYSRKYSITPSLGTPEKCFPDDIQTTKDPCIKMESPWWDGLK